MVTRLQALMVEVRHARAATHILKRARQGRLAYGTPFITVDRYHTDSQRPPEASVKAKLEKQLRAMRRVSTLRNGSTPITAPRVTVSGKVDDTGAVNVRLQDDVAMALILGAYWQHKLSRGSIEHAPAVMRMPR
jgi:hypothetical protein